MEIRCKVTQSNGADLRYDNTDPTVSETLVNNSLYSIFSDCTLSANGLKISNANSNFEHKSFIGTEFSNSKGAKDSWFKCQGYRFENNPAAIDAADFTSQRELVRELRKIWFYGPAGVDFFTCDKHLLSGVTLRLSYRRSHEDFLIISEDAAKHYKLQILDLCSLPLSNFAQNSCELPISRRIYKNISCNSWSAQLATGGYFCS